MDGEQRCAFVLKQPQKALVDQEFGFLFIRKLIAIVVTVPSPARTQMDGGNGLKKSEKNLSNENFRQIFVFKPYKPQFKNCSFRKLGKILILLNWLNFSRKMAQKI